MLKKQSNRYRQNNIVGRISSSITPCKVGNSSFYTSEPQGTAHSKGISETVQASWYNFLAWPSYSFLYFQIHRTMLVVGNQCKLLLTKWALILHEDFLVYDPIFSQLKIPFPYHPLQSFLGETADPTILLQFFCPSFKHLMLFWLWKSGDCHHSLTC